MEQQPRDYTELYTIGKQILEEYKNKLTEVDAVAEGKLKGTADYNFDIKENVITLRFILEDYWRTIEYGRGKTNNSEGGVLRPLIERWIAVKGITPKEPEMPLERLSYLITRKIHRKGYKGREPLKKALAQAQTDGLTDKLGNSVADLYHKEVTVELEDLNNKKGIGK